jgi:hypothetical protein
METILKKARIILRNMYIALGATAMPILIHAMYGMRQPDPDSYTVPFQGRVVSEETGEPVSGIIVSIHSTDGNTGEYGYTHFYSGFEVSSDNDGQFYIQVPERDSYFIYFSDANGLFHRKDIRVTADEIKQRLKVDLEQRIREDGE